MANAGRILAGAGTGAATGGLTAGPLGAFVGGLSGLLSGIFGGGGSAPKPPPPPLQGIGFNAQPPPAPPPPQFVPMPQINPVSSQPGAEMYDMQGIPDAAKQAALRRYMGMQGPTPSWTPDQMSEWDFLKNG